MGKPGNSSKAKAPTNNARFQGLRSVLGDSYIDSLNKRIDEVGEDDAKELFNNAEWMLKAQRTLESGAYDLDTGVVEFNPDAPRSIHTGVHEFTHAMDFFLDDGSFSSNYPISKTLKKDFRKNSGSINYDFSDDTFSGLSDTLSGVIQNKAVEWDMGLRWGHKTSYWKRGGAKIVGQEFLAQYVAAKLTNPTELAAFRNVFPEASAMGDKIIAEMNAQFSVAKGS